MKKALKWIFGIIFALVLLLLITALLLPSTYHVEREVEVTASPDAVSPYIQDFRRWNEWTIWSQNDPTMTLEYSDAEGEPVKPGSWYTWVSAPTPESGYQPQGTGKMTITGVEEGTLHYELEFEGYDEPATGTIRVEPVEGEERSRVVWTMEGDLGGLAYRLTGPFMDTLVGSQFDVGLDNLKALAEGNAPPPQPSTEKEGTNKPAAN